MLVLRLESYNTTSLTSYVVDSAMKRIGFLRKVIDGTNSQINRFKKKIFFVLPSSRATLTGLEGRIVARGPWVAHPCFNQMSTKIYKMFLQFSDREEDDLILGTFVDGYKNRIPKN